MQASFYVANQRIWANFAIPATANLQHMQILPRVTQTQAIFSTGTGLLDVGFNTGDEIF